MVLVDTSVWIRFLSNRAPYAAAALDELLRARTGHAYGNTYALTATWRHTLPRRRQTER